MISNPCADLIGWSDRKEFTYEGGRKLFHFSPYDSNLSTTMEMNIVFFADNKTHAVDVLTRMLNFIVDSLEQYKKSTGHEYEYCDNTYYPMLLKNKNKWVIKEAPMNQFYKVGWAFNDTIL